MNKSQRIHLDVNSVETDKHIKVRLEQNIDTLEFLSMSIGSKEIYRSFNADYGVLVGRVIANGGIGIPNARISVFIPLSEEDAADSETYSLYPYKTPRDKNSEGKRYNLLPRVSRYNPETGTVTPKQPFGSFPIIEELMVNDQLMKVYKKYYKYTALTNNSGDYMIFGVPVGTQTVHLSVDITDIGEFSMTPAAMVTNLGYSPNLFTNNNARIKPSNDLDDLPHIETQEISVNVVPFWGDTENFEIGITRQDFRIRSVLRNTFVIFGSVFTDGDECMWGHERINVTPDRRRIEELFHAGLDEHYTIGMASKRAAKVTEKIFYYPADITDAEINSSAVDTDKMVQLQPSEYSAYKRDGDFVFIINCNRDKIIMDEMGNKVPVDNDSPDGVFTKFKGFITLEITEETLPMNFSSDIGKKTTVKPFRYRLKFPQHAARNQSFTANKDDQRTKEWRKQHYTFSAGCFYSVAKFHGLIQNFSKKNKDQFSLNNGFFKADSINKANHGQNGVPSNMGIILNGAYGISKDGDEGGDKNLYDNAQFQFPSNSTITDMEIEGESGTYNVPCFGSNWMNFSVYLPQVGYLTRGWAFLDDVRVADHFTRQIKDNVGQNSHFLEPNLDPIAAGVFNTQFMPRSDLNWTDFILVDREDIVNLNRVQTKGVTTYNDGITIDIANEHADTYELKGTYRNGKKEIPNWPTPCPIGGGKINGDPANPTKDGKTYLYKGFGDADCIGFLYELEII